MSHPLVTCICLTTATRAAWLPRAVDCFRAQTYAHKQLLIVGEPDYCPMIFIEGVRVLSAPAGLTLGGKHNFACESVGDLIAKWDDDDWSSRERLTDQVARLQSTGREFTGYSQMKFTDGARWWKYVCAPGWPLGTSLMFKKAWWESHRFPNRQKASDNALCEVAQLEQQPIVAAGNIMVASIHSGNTNPAGSGDGERHLHNPSKYLPLDPAREAVPAALAGWPRAEALAC